MDNQQLVAKAFENATRDNGSLPPDYIAEVFQQQIKDLPDIQRVCGDQRRVLMVGAGGYVGTVVAQYLLTCGYAVRCVDPFVYGNDQAISHLLNAPGFEYVNADMGAIDSEIDDVTDVVILGGLVGDPITKKYPEQSAAINETAISDLLDRLAGKTHLKRVIFVSTCSNYGLIEDDQLATETTELRPLSLYAQAKVGMEQKLLSLKGKASFEGTVLRFATAFGLSPRMRFDLTVNQFSRELALRRELVVFDPDTWRPYCHVVDFATLIRRVLEAPAERVSYEVFNAGGNVNNSTKRTLVETIQKFVPDTRITIQKEGPDPRNYRVDFAKVVEKLHFTPTWTVENGVRQVVDSVGAGLFRGADELYGNYTLVAPWDQVGK